MSEREAMNISQKLPTVTVVQERMRRQFLALESPTVLNSHDESISRIHDHKFNNKGISRSKLNNACIASPITELAHNLSDSLAMVDNDGAVRYSTTYSIQSDVSSERRRSDSETKSFSTPEQDSRKNLMNEWTSSSHNSSATSVDSVILCVEENGVASHSTGEAVGMDCSFNVPDFQSPAPNNLKQGLNTSTDSNGSSASSSSSTSMKKNKKNANSVSLKNCLSLMYNKSTTPLSTVSNVSKRKLNMEVMGLGRHRVVEEEDENEESHEKLRPLVESSKMGINSSPNNVKNTKLNDLCGADFSPDCNKENMAPPPTSSIFTNVNKMQNVQSEMNVTKSFVKYHSFHDQLLKSSSGSVCCSSPKNDSTAPSTLMNAANCFSKRSILTERRETNQELRVDVGRYCSNIHTDDDDDPLKDMYPIVHSPNSPKGGEPSMQISPSPPILPSSMKTFSSIDNLLKRPLLSSPTYNVSSTVSFFPSSSSSSSRSNTKNGGLSTICEENHLLFTQSTSPASSKQFCKKQRFSFSSTRDHRDTRTATTSSVKSTLAKPVFASRSLSMVEEGSNTKPPKPTFRRAQSSKASSMDDGRRKNDDTNLMPPPPTGLLNFSCNKQTTSMNNASNSLDIKSENGNGTDLSSTHQKRLTSDYSRVCALDTMSVSQVTKNSDLNNIDCHVLADLMSGKYSHIISSFRIIDARYRYEYEGGHIRGAANFGHWDEETFFRKFLHEQKQDQSSSSDGTLLVQKEVDGQHQGMETSATIVDECCGSATEGEDKRDILVFHCEFSSSRGPALMRDLRNRDRHLNRDVYPKLRYPEMYLLHAGYKELFENYPHLCEPQSYQPMKDPKFSSLEKSFRKKSKSWAAAGSVARTLGTSRITAKK